MVSSANRDNVTQGRIPDACGRFRGGWGRRGVRGGEGGCRRWLLSKGRYRGKLNRGSRFWRGRCRVLGDGARLLATVFEFFRISEGGGIEGAVLVDQPIG